MLKFVILSSNKENIRGYDLIVDKLLMEEEFEYKCYNFDDNDKELHEFIKRQNDNTIYIIDEDTKFNPTKIIETIRKTDLESFIITIDIKNKIKESFIEDNYFINTKVIKDKSKLSNILKKIISLLIKKNNKLSYLYNGCFYNIDFSKILYIEKQLDSKLCSIICTDKTYYINCSIKKVKGSLSNDFVQTHQSAIVNLNNVLTIDFNNKTIEFINEYKTELFSRSYKKELKEIITKKSQKITE